MISEIFIRRTRLAIVISIIISIAGAIAIFSLPIQQYPQITPPTVNVSAVYPGASAEGIADVVGGPLETAINGVDGMTGNILCRLLLKSGQIPNWRRSMFKTGRNWQSRVCLPLWRSRVCRSARVHPISCWG
mgnify:CR=1 FL=1